MPAEMSSRARTVSTVPSALSSSLALAGTPESCEEFRYQVVVTAQPEESLRTIQRLLTSSRTKWWSSGPWPLALMTCGWAATDDVSISMIARGAAG